MASAVTLLSRNPARKLTHSTYIVNLEHAPFRAQPIIAIRKEKLTLFR